MKENNYYEELAKSSVLWLNYTSPLIFLGLPLKTELKAIQRNRWQVWPMATPPTNPPGVKVKHLPVISPFTYKPNDVRLSRGQLTWNPLHSFHRNTAPICCQTPCSSRESQQKSQKSGLILSITHKWSASCSLLWRASIIWNEDWKKFPGTRPLSQSISLVNICMIILLYQLHILMQYIWVIDVEKIWSFNVKNLYMT